jgi:hypothetical protein
MGQLAGEDRHCPARDAGPGSSFPLGSGSSEGGAHPGPAPVENTMPHARRKTTRFPSSAMSRSACPARTATPVQTNWISRQCADPARSPVITSSTCATDVCLGSMLSATTLPRRMTTIRSTTWRASHGGALQTRRHDRGRVETQISNSTPISMICEPGILKNAPGRWAL